MENNKGRIPRKKRKKFPTDLIAIHTKKANMFLVRFTGITINTPNKQMDIVA